MYSSTTKIPGASTRLNEIVSVVRLYLRDFPELNRLIQGEETSDRMIAWSVVDALDDFNSTPPFVGSYGQTNFPSLSLLREGAVIRVLESVGLLQLRNQMNYSDGEITVQISDKSQFLMGWINMLRGSYEQKKVRIKSSINVEQAFEGSGIHSEYFVINGVYFSGY